MATDNPKVSGYLPPAVYDQLIEFKNARAFNSVSLALTAALQEFFRLAPIDPAIATTDNERLEEVEGKVERLIETVAQLSQAIATLQASSLPVVHSKPPTEVLPQQGLEESASSELPVVHCESLEMAIADNISAAISSSPVAQSEPTDDTSLSDSSPLRTDSELPIDTVVSAGSPPIDESEPSERAIVSAQSVDYSEPLEEVKRQLTREELGKVLGTSRQNITNWEKSGKLAQDGWVVVPGTGSSPKNPIKYQKQV